MRFPGKKSPVRVTASAVALGLVAVLITAAPAWAAAAVTSFTPVCGVVGTPVTLTGTGFTGSTAVTFPGAIDQSTLTGLTDTSVTAAVPVGATGSGTLTVVNAGGDGVSATSFTVATAAAATITSFAPTSGLVGASVVITGTGFCGSSVVKFNTTDATAFTVNSDTQITATVPVGAATGKISVTNTIGTVISTADFSVVGIPTITSFTPTIGDLGTAVTLTGTNFTGTTSVKFNGTSATFTIVSDTSITTAVPIAATSGAISVSNPAGTATSVALFTVGSAEHTRSVTFSYKKTKASGHVGVGDSATSCVAFVPVYIQMRKNGAWRLLDTTATNASGNYKTWVPNKSGKFRAQVQAWDLPDGSTCQADNSPTVKHKK